MSGGDDWASGDLALCVRVNEHIDPRSDRPRPGGVYLVSGVVRAAGKVGLQFSALRSARAGYLATCFKRIAPLTDEEQRRALEDLDVPAPVVPA